MPRGLVKKNSMRRQAASALLTAAAVFVVAQGGLRWLIDHRWQAFRDPPFEAKLAKLEDRLAKQPTRPWTVAMIGSSLTQHAFRGPSIEVALQNQSERPVVAFNLGTFAAGPLTELLYVRRMLERGVRPDLVLLEAFPMYHNAVHGHLDTGKFQPQVLSRRDLRLIERHQASTPELRAAWLEVQFFPFYGHRLALQSGLTPLLVPVHDRQNFWANMDACGCVPLAEVPPQERARLLDRPRQQCGPYLRTYEPGGPPGQALGENLALLKKEKIPTAVVFMPEGDTMQRLYPPGAADQFRDYLRKTCELYGAEMIDARDWIRGEDGFIDSYHLGLEGARRFSERLTRECLTQHVGQ